MTTPRPFVWLGSVPFERHTAYELSCYDHGALFDESDGRSEMLMTLRRARHVRRQHLSDYHGRRWLWDDDDRRAWDER